jgi:hypothetical protein
MYSTLVPCESILPDVVGIAFQQVIGMVRPPMTQRGLGPIFLYVLFLEAIHVQAPSPVCFEGIRSVPEPMLLELLVSNGSAEPLGEKNGSIY